MFAPQSQGPDDSATQRAENELATLRAAVEASGEVIFMTDRSGVFTYVNPAFSRVYGFAAVDVVGKTTPRILKSGKVPQDQYPAFWAALLRKEIVVGEITNKAKDGRLVVVEASVNPVLNAAGDIIAFLAVQRDMTEKKRLDEQMARTQKMEAVGLLAGGVAHDFNNLLSVITSYAALIEEQLNANDPIRDDIGEISKAARRAARVAKQLLIFSRKGVVKPEVLDLNNAVVEIEKLLRRALGEAVQLSTSLGEDLWRTIADRGQIDQVIVNIATNARDAMPNGGRLAIETANVAFETSSADRPASLNPGRYVRLAITDTGHGIPVDVIGRIFEPFFTTKAVGKGTGLGLSIVYGIVTGAGGEITVESTPGVGTTFRIYLPATDAPGAEARATSRTPQLEGHGESILVVEDEDAVRTLACRILGRAGYKVVEAANGGEALLICDREGAYAHLLLTDVVLPHMSGKELAERLVTNCPEMRVLYMSGYAESHIAHDGVLDPGINFLPKPFTPVDLLAAVRNALR